MRLRVRRHLHRFLGTLIEGVRRIPDQRSRRLELRDHLGAQMLHGLERRDGATELDALLRVGHGHLDRALAGAERVGRDRDAAGRDHAIDEPGRRDRLAGRDAREAELRDAARAVDGRERRHREARRVARHERDAIASERDQEGVRGAGVDREERGARDAIALDAEARIAALRHRFGQRGADHDLAGRDARQPLRLQRRRCRSERDRREHAAREERRGRGAVAERLRNERRVEQTERASTVRLGHQHAGRAELREVGPDLGVVRGVGGHDLAHAGRGHRLVEVAT